MKFSVPWGNFPSVGNTEEPRPLLAPFLRTTSGRFVRETFVVDSGADFSMASRDVCELLGLDWSEGELTQLRGISPRDECVVAAAVHYVDLYVREADFHLVLPICFAEGDAPSLLGRRGFFDHFRVLFDKRQLLTQFEIDK